MTLLLTDFRSLCPAHVSTQAHTMEWLAEAHTRAEATRAHQQGRPFSAEAFRSEMERRIARFGCGPNKIAQRGHVLPDILHTRWDDMQIYRLHEEDAGRSISARTEAFVAAAEGAMVRLYGERDAPADLLHVTCTGYASPSPAQRLVAQRGWGDHTRVFHVYHMGCYAAFPAVRAASGFLHDRRGGRTRGRVDIVHTELCSLHLDPTRHTPEQLVVQTLFADGFIAYTACDDATWSGTTPALRLLAIDESLLPDSADAMTWTCSAHGMQMSLARDVPQRIGTSVWRFVERLAGRVGLAPRELRRAVFAVHPGGPRILDHVAGALDLRADQLASSHAVLRDHGNMSSATLPHVWAKIAADPDIPDGTVVISLAFGPGLTICGSVCRKEAG